MLSRVADSIYWMNRYIERAENIARFIEVNMRLTLDLPFKPLEQWEPLIVSSGDSALFYESYTEAIKEKVIQFLAFDTNYPNSILSCLSAARENARTVREIISSEMWEQINQFYFNAKDVTLTNMTMDEVHSFFNDIKKESHLFTGISDATMSHGEAWHFGWLGRLVERADKTSRILDAKQLMLLPTQQDVKIPYDRYQWSYVLRSVSALEMYRKNRLRRIIPREVADYLILDRFFPRSIHYCLIRGEKALHAITDSPAGTFKNRAEKLLGRLRSELDYTDIDDVMDMGLHEFCDSFQIKLNAVGDAIYETFIALHPATK